MRPARSSVGWVGAVAWLVLTSAVIADEAPGPDERLGRAIALYQSGAREQARGQLLALVADHPQHHRALWNVGLVQMEDEDPDEAMRWFERAIAIDDGQADYHLWRGYAQVKRLERAGALRKLFLAPKVRASFERAVELDPQHLQARRALMEYYERAPGIVGGGSRKAREQAEAIQRLEAGASDSVEIADEPQEPRRPEEQDVGGSERQ